MTHSPDHDPVPTTGAAPGARRPSLAESGERWSYFGWAERPYFRRMSEFRYELFGFFLRPLARRGVRPNHITAASFLTVLVGFPLFYGAGRYGAAFAALAVHILLDGLDGPLAKIVGKKNTAQGALMDMSNDVTGIVIVVFTVSFFGPVPWFLGTVYAVTYLYLTIFAVAQNLLDLRYAYVVKTKYTVYVLLVVWWLTGVDLVSPVTALATVYMGVSAFFGFVRVTRALR
ncbi:MAG: CDP-alcohol phosphatidyltransferase family protein [Deltaproteobacteria bacterium]|nr:CDP-alcohol phosphatidyltransferase family protein [Deltaproteobacteria bacterium]